MVENMFFLYKCMLNFLSYKDPGYKEPRLKRTNFACPMMFVISEFDCTSQK